MPPRLRHFRALSHHLLDTLQVQCPSRFVTRPVSVRVNKISRADERMTGSVQLKFPWLVRLVFFLFFACFYFLVYF